MSKETVCIVDKIVTKCVIEEMGKNPLSFIPIVQEIIDPNNPDSKKLVSMISESVTSSILGDDTITNEIKNRVADCIEHNTTKEVFNIINQQRLSLSNDAKKFLEDIARNTIVNLCEKYFMEQKKKIDTILDDYFKTIKNYIERKIKEDQKKQEKSIKKKTKGKIQKIDVPDEYKNDVMTYIDFLKNREVIS